MNEARIQELHRGGIRPARIAATLGCSRSDVDRVITTMQAGRALRRNTLLAVLLIGVFICCIGGVWGFVSQSTIVPTIPTPERPQAVLHEHVQSYLAAHPDPTWFLASVPPEPTQETFDGLQGVRVRIEQALATYRTIPDVRRLHDMFGNRIILSHYSPFGGGSSRLIARTREELERFEQGELLEVVLVAKESEHAPRLRGNSFFYDAGWEAIMLSAITLTDPWFDALLLHELEHARLHRIGAASSIAPAMSDEWIREEIDAHRLEHGVLVHASPSYGVILQRIAMRHRSAPSAPEFLRRIRTDDLLALDRAFPPANVREAGLRCTQYQLDLTRTWISLHSPEGSDVARLNADAYRGIRAR